MELIEGDVKVEFCDLGEGYCGEYNDADPEDEYLLRFDVYHLRAYSSVDFDWEPVDDASYCTLVPASTPEDVQAKLLQIIMNEVYEPVTHGTSVKKLCERLSHINPTWAA